MTAKERSLKFLNHSIIFGVLDASRYLNQNDLQDWNLISVCLGGSSIYRSTLRWSRCSTRVLHFTSLQLSGLDFSLATQVDLQVVQHWEACWLSVPENETSADWCFYCFEMFLLKKRQLFLTAHYDCRQRRVFVVSWLPADGFNDNERENQTGSKKYSLRQSL